MKQVVIYTDGACDPNPGGRGGYGIIMSYKGTKKEFSGGFQATTNNRMELYAAIKALELLKEPCEVTLYSDSNYMVRGINEGWAVRWRKNNWMRTKKEAAANADLWEKLLIQCEKHQVVFEWVEGHAGHRENERCDYLAVTTSQQDGLLIDEGYENRPEELEKSSEKMEKEGQPCRKCSTPVIKRKPKKIKKKNNYYYEYYLFCPQCKTLYFVDEAKRMINDEMRERLTMTEEGQPCAKCATPVVGRISRKGKYHLFCPNCKAAYELKDAVSKLKRQQTLF